MIGGKYDNDEQLVWNSCEYVCEVNFDTLAKAAALLSVACIILRKYPGEGLRNDYIKNIIGALWHHKIHQDDATKIITTTEARARGFKPETNPSDVARAPKNMPNNGRLK